jgi:hypothetical protein
MEYWPMSERNQPQSSDLTPESLQQLGEAREIEWPEWYCELVKEARLLGPQDDLGERWLPMNLCGDVEHIKSETQHARKHWLGLQFSHWRGEFPPRRFTDSCVCVGTDYEFGRVVLETSVPEAKLWLYRPDEELRVWVDIERHFPDIRAFVSACAEAERRASEERRRKAAERSRAEGRKWSP